MKLFHKGVTLLDCQLQVVDSNGVTPIEFVGHVEASTDREGEKRQAAAVP